MPFVLKLGVLWMGKMHNAELCCSQD